MKHLRTYIMHYHLVKDKLENYMDVEICARQRLVETCKFSVVNRNQKQYNEYFSLKEVVMCISSCDCCLFEFSSLFLTNLVRSFIFTALIGLNSLILFNMKFIQKIIWWLIAVNTLNIIYFSNASIPAQVSEQLKYILKSCFADRLNPVFISEDLTDIAYTEIIDPSTNVTFFETDYPVIVINNTFRAKNIEAFYNPRYPTYVLSVKSVKKLKTTLRELASLSTWNVNSHFFIIRYNKNDCDKNGEKVLKVVWKMDLLSSLYVCLEPDNNETRPANVIADTRTMLYTFNPFSNHAPLPWQEIHRVNQSIDDNRLEQDQDKFWTLYKQPYLNDTKLCPSLTFDKTKHLNGYPIKAVSAAKPNTNWTPNDPVNIKKLQKTLSYPHLQSFETSFSSFNVTPIINYRKIGDYVNNTPVGLLKPIINGTHNVCLNLQFISNDSYKFVDFINPGSEDDLFV